MKNKIIIKDNLDNNVEVDSIKFIKHINQYHNSGVSIHEEKGHYYRVDDKFRKMLNKKIEKDN